MFLYRYSLSSSPPEAGPPPYSELILVPLRHDTLICGWNMWCTTAAFSPGGTLIRFTA